MLILLGFVIGVAASFTGLGGGFLLVPLLLFLGYKAGKAVGTSFLVILIISISAVIAHKRLEHIDTKVALFLALGGVIGAQIGAKLVDQFPTDVFNKIFAVILILIAIRIAYL